VLAIARFETALERFLFYTPKCKRCVGTLIPGLPACVKPPASMYLSPVIFLRDYRLFRGLSVNFQALTGRDEISVLSREAVTVKCEPVRDSHTFLSSTVSTLLGRYTLTLESGSFRSTPFYIRFRHESSTKVQRLLSCFGDLPPHVPQPPLSRTSTQSSFFRLE
jgi:hypothetical protein